MEQLFAVRVLVHYYDKPKVDHAAVRRLLSAAQVDSLQMLMADGTVLTLSDHMNGEKDCRKPVSEILGSCGSALVQVASVFMLAEARAAADAIDTNSSDLETACSALERLLGCVATQRPLIPQRDIIQSAKVRLGTAARRRALCRLSGSSSPNSSHVSILKAVNAVLRLCDVATHCLAVVSRQSLSRKSACETAVSLSTRLLTLAVSLYEVQRTNAAPALSFFSSNSLRTALVTGAMHLGAIIIEHSQIEPMGWIHVANRILMRNSTPAPHRTSVLSALFGGMIRAGKRYQSSDRDTGAAEGAVCLLSTLHIALEADTMEDARVSPQEHKASQKVDGLRTRASGDMISRTSKISSAPVSQAARSFLGERVIAAEEDGDEGRIAARTAYQACEEYAERAGETKGMVDFLVELFSSAGRQCRQECSEEPVVSISEGTLPCPPDESDASSEGPQGRSDSHQFSIDVFDNKSRDGLGTGPIGGSNSEMSMEQIERIEMHREIGALSLECLAHWLNKPQGDHRYTNFDVIEFGIRICRSASLFIMSNSSASYDLKSAMVDFGALIGPILKQRIEELPGEARPIEWNKLVISLVEACHRTNPVLSGIVSPTAGDGVLSPLLDAFLSSKEGLELQDESASDEISRLPTESILELLLSTIRRDNAMQVVEKVSQSLKKTIHTEMTAESLIYCTSSLILLSHAVNVILEVEEAHGHIRLAFAALFHRDVDFVLDPALPDGPIETTPEQVPYKPHKVNRAQAAILVSSLMHVPDIIGRICAHSKALLRRHPSSLAGKSCELVYADYSSGLNTSEKLCYHFFWSCLMVEDLMRVMKTMCQTDPSWSLEKKDLLSDLPLSGPYVCAKATSSASFRHQLVKELQSKEERSFAMLYVAECTALLQAQTSASPDAEVLETLLAAIVDNVTDLVSNSFYKDIPKNYKTLYDSFLRDPLWEVSRPETHDSQVRQKTFKERLKVGVEGSCLSLAMHYMRAIGLGNTPDLLADVLMSATELLHRLSREQLVRAQQWILEVPNHILFLPASFSRLRGSMCNLLETYLTMTLNVPLDSIRGDNTLLTFISRVCGFSYLVKKTPSSAQEIQAFCKFAHDTASNEDVDMDALRKSMDCSFVYKDERVQVRDFVANALPTSSLSRLLEHILVPGDESAVAVSSHSHSLSLLTKTCEASDLWKTSAIGSLGSSFTSDKDGIVPLMIQRSVMQSATMNDGVLSIFEKVLGTSDSQTASRILVTAFRATRAQLEKDLDATLECLLRLLNFAVRATVSHGYIRNRIDPECEREGDFLGAELIDLLFAALHKTTEKVLSGTKDKVSEQMILFLCSLIDCVHESLYERRGSFFDHVGGTGSRESISEKSDDTEKMSSEEPSKSSELPLLPNQNEENQNEESCSQEQEDSSQSSLCTYTSTGSQFVKQHWYFCYSCDLAGSEGVCSVCARVCHKDCEVAYSKFSRFFCDCGAGSDARQEATSQAVASSEDGEGANASASEVHSSQFAQGQVKSRKPCLCLNSRKDEVLDCVTIDNERQVDPSLSSFQNDRDKVLGIQLRDLLSSELKAIKAGDLCQQQKQRVAIEEALTSHLSSNRTTYDLTATALFLTKELGDCHTINETRSTWISLRSLSAEIDRKREASNLGRVITGISIASLAKILKASSYEISGPSTTTRQSQGSLIAFSPQERIVAIAEKSGCVNFLSAPSLLARGIVSEKKPSLSHRRVRVSHNIWDLQFHPGNSNLLLAVGNETVSILCRLSEPDGGCWHNVNVEIGMSEYEGSDGTNTLVRASWVNEKSTLLLVLTEQFVKIFDVAVDTFCPCFFSKIPPIVKGHLSSSSADESTEVTEEEEKDNVKPVLIGAAVLVEDMHQEGNSGFYVFLLTSIGELLLSKSRRNDTSPPVFSNCFSVRHVCGGVVTPFSIQVICDSYARVMLMITSADGSMVCASIALRDRDDELQCTVSWLHVYNDAFNPGAIPELQHVPGTEMTFLFFQRGKILEGAGAIAIRQDNLLEVQSFGGTPSATVMGLATFGPSSSSKESSRGGGFLVLDDGSLHRVDLQRGRKSSPSKATDSASLPSVLERQRIRAGKLADRHKEDRDECDPVPDAIGFFEKCRIVSDHISTEMLDGEAVSGSPQARLGALTSDADGDCVLSVRPNHPFKFAVSIENNSLVLVGARLLLGATERSRNRVPGTVKVFDRTVHWKSKNGLKRWLDIPLTVAESTTSPQRISFELTPKRYLDEISADLDGLVAFDCLELYAVSSIEFTERKLLHERRKEKFIEALRERQESNHQSGQQQQTEVTDPEIRKACSIAKDVKFSEDQAALLAVVSAIGSEKFSSGEQSAELFLELNNQWSSVFEDRSLEKQPFLEHVRKVVSALCFGERKYTSNSSDHVEYHGAEFMSKGIEHVMRTNDEFFNNNGVAPHILTVEKLLFAIGGLSRALLYVATKTCPSEKEIWIQIYERVMPKDQDMLSLLQEFLSVGCTGRLLCKSSYGATVNAVDIIMVRSLKQNVLRARSDHLRIKDDFIILLVEFLCSLDQDRRLEAGQRTMDFYDSLDDPAELFGSPFELNMATAISDNIKSQNIASKNMLEASAGNENLSEGSDETQRWAYRCDSCGKVCDREWWHCNECEDFDLCTACLRSKSTCQNGAHKPDHILLRGCASNDLDQQVLFSERKGQIWEVVLSVQERFEGFVNEIVAHMERRGDADRPWRYIDALEAISQLLGPSSPQPLREPRVRALFRSRFPDVIKSRAESVGSDFDTVQLHRQTSVPGLVQKCNVLALMLRVLLSAPHTSMSAHLHRYNIPLTLFDLLRNMHPRLRALARHVSTGNAFESPGEARCDLMARSVWNKSISDLTYTIMSQKRTTNHADSLTDMFETSSGSESTLGAFLCVMVEVMQVLEYCFKSASNASITEQMQSIPRNILCDIINFCETVAGKGYKAAFKHAASAAKRLLTTLSLDDTNMLNHVLDRYLYEEQTSRLQDALTREISGPSASYDSAVELAGIVTTLHKAASIHSDTWRSYVTGNEDVLQNIYKTVKRTEGQMQVLALQLLAAAVATSPGLARKVIKSLPIVEWNQPDSQSKQEIEAPDSTRSPGNASSTGLKPNHQLPSELIQEYQVHPQVSIAIFNDEDFEILQFLVQRILLRAQVKESRVAAGHFIMFAIIKGAAEGDGDSLTLAVQKALHSGLDCMPFAGDIADSLMSCLRFLIYCCRSDIFGESSGSTLKDFTSQIATLLKKRCRLLVSHPNARLYGRLSEVIDVSGYYLESDPCLTCAAATWESTEGQERRLDTIRAETKYTATSIMHRLVSIYEVTSITVKIIDPRRTQRAKKIDVLYSSKAVSDAAELKRSDHPWKKLTSLELDVSATECSGDLIIPIALANIKLAFTEFHELSELSQQDGDSLEQAASSPVAPTSRHGSNARTTEALHCPRCSRSVTDRHGICRICHENAYQCRQCRNINYENLDGFLCNECGYCKHGRFEFSISGRPTFVAEPIENEQDRKRASKIIERETSNVHRCIEQLAKFRSSIIRSLISGMPLENGKEKGRLISVNKEGLADLLDMVAPRSDIAVLEAILEGQATGQDIEEATNSTQGGVSVTEEVIAEGNGAIEVGERDQGNRPGSTVASPVNRIGRSDSQPKAHQAEPSVISRNTSTLAVTYARECRALFSTMSRSIRVLMLTRAALVSYANNVGGQRRRQAKDFKSDQVAKKGTVIQDDTSLSDVVTAKKQLSVNSVCCYGCTQSFISKAVNLLQAILKCEGPTQFALQSADLARDMMLICALCHKHEVRNDIRDLITYLVNENMRATQLVCSELSKKIGFCIDSYETIDSHSVARFEVNILEATSVIDDSCWEERLKLVIRILFKASSQALTCSSVAESIILPCLRVAMQLLKADVGLTVVGESSAAEGYDRATEVSKVPGTQLQSMDSNENESFERSNTSLPGMLTAPSLRETRSKETSRQERTADDDDNLVTEGERQTDIATRSGAGISSTVGRDPSLLDRKPNQYTGSSHFSGSGAPSSIGTTVDVHVSDDEVVPAEDGDFGISMAQMTEVLESEHDANRVTANVRQWLDGRQTQSAWMASITGKLLEPPGKPKLPETNKLSEDIHTLRKFFTQWKRSKGCHGTMESDSNGAFDETCDDEERLLIQKENWIVRLMLFTPCADVRREACALLHLLCGDEEMMQLHLLDLLTGSALKLGAEVGEKSKEFFDLLESALTSKTHRLYVMMREFLPRLAALIQSRAEELVRCETGAGTSVQLVNFSEGYSLKRLISLLRLLLDAIPTQQSYLRQRLLERENQALVSSLQRAYIDVRKLISMRTRLTDESGAQLSEILLSQEFLFTGPTVSAIVSACVSELKTANQRNDAQSVALLLEELCLMLCPERQEPTCLLVLQKTPTQEEFIRGNMSRNPYVSSSFDGPLMRDVKNKICKDLDLPGLLEDDFAMELLVAGNLVKLDLPIMGVYEHIWRGSTAASMTSSIPPAQISRAFGLRRGSQSGGSRANGSNSRSAGIRGTILSIRRMNSGRDIQEAELRTDGNSDPPMIVVYRLSGLDGEATEPIVDSLPKESGTETDGEEMYKDTIVFGEVGGLSVLLELLAVVGSWGDDAETAIRAPALRLLRCSCEVAKNRALLSKSPDAVGTLLDCAASAFEHAQGSPTAVISAESLLIAAERILAQQRKEMDSKTPVTNNAMCMSSHDPDEVMARVRVFLGRLAVATSATAEDSILHLLPFLVQGIAGAIDLVLTHLRFSKDNLDDQEEEQHKVHQLGTVLLATPHDLSGNELAVKTIEAGIYEDAVSYVTKRFPAPRRQNKATWEVSLQSRATPLLLRLLTGLSFFLSSSQGQLSAGQMLRSILDRRSELIPILCQLEMAVSENAVGTSAEELLDALSRNDDIQGQIEDERQAIKAARREAARASRAAILKEVGLLAEPEKQAPPKPAGVEPSTEGSPEAEDSVLKLMAELPDEVGPSCVVCGDGFQCRPEETLALYVYCRKVSLDITSNLTVSQDRTQGDTDSRQTTRRPDWEAWASGRGRDSNGQSKSSANSCFTTVTHMNAIHPSCHKEASRVDRTSRRDEWDGASLRNSQTKCNNMFPLRPPVTLELQETDETASIMKLARSSYSAAVDGYFSRLTSLGRTSLSQAKIGMYDLGRSLLRFADGGTTVFSEHSKGGGPHANACMIPHLVQLLIYLIECSSSTPKDDPFSSNTVLQTQEAALAKYLFEDEPGDVTYYLASSVVLQDLNSWGASIVKFLKRGMMESVLPLSILFRIVATSDAVHRCLKNKLVTSTHPWLESFRRHIGMDVTFPANFGDAINENWERYLRRVSTSEDFVDAIQRNMEVEHALSKDNGELISTIKDYLRNASNAP